MRRPLVLPVLLASVLGLAACGGGADTTEPPTPAPTSADSPSTEATTTPTTAPTTAPSTEPTTGPTGTGTTVAADCSASGLTDAGADVADLPAEARATASFLLDAAVRCDEQLLATAAFESGTQLTFGDADPYEFFGLPEDDEQVYSVIVTLLTEVPHAAEGDDATPATFVWPRVHTSDWAEVDEAWQEVVDAGLLTAAEADEQRAAGTGYLGWRMAISGDGTWRYLVAGD